MAKRNMFMKAGAIIGIISSSFLILSSVGMLMSTGMISYEMIVEVLTAEGVISDFSAEMINLMVEITRVIYSLIGTFTFGLAIAGLVLSIKLLNQANSNINKKGYIIALLVISILTANLITAGFMITALCLRKGPIRPTPAGVEADEEQFSN